MSDGNVFPRRLDKTLRKAIKAEGVYIIDENGKRYIDASGGPICVNVGHGRREIAEIASRQMAELAYVHGTMFTTGVLEELAHELAKHAPPNIEKFYFCSSGSEAVETALKLARQVHIAKGDPSRYKVVARWQSYHGSTLGALSVTGKTSMRDPFVPMLMEVVHVPPPYCLRCHFGYTYPSCGLRCAYALEEAILSEGAEYISAFIAETICGATLGAVVPPKEYYTIVADICKRYGILLILDEVMCGLGRTGRWFAFEHYGIQPDLLVLGKGLGGGYFPLSAVGCSSSFLELIRQHKGNFVHGHTYSHHAVGAAVGLSVLRILEREGLIEQASKKGTYFQGLLKNLLGHKNVVDVRGIGLMIGVELAMEKETLEPFPRAERVTERLLDALYEDGVLAYPTIGFAKGKGDCLMFGPPYVIEERDMEEVVEKLSLALKRVLG